MAPTEILAEQHFKSLTKILTTDDGRRTTDNEASSEGSKVQSLPLSEAKGPKSKARSRKTDAETQETPIQNPTVRLLKGSTPRKEKLQIYKEIASGEVDIVVGTHALIQEGVNFKRLGLVVVDEQHRFGVAQRDVLRQKGH